MNANSVIYKDLVVIGGGPGGMAAAIAAKDRGIEDVLVVEREDCLGGILQQCVHSGFGLSYYGEELTGPEYAWRHICEVETHGVEYWLESTVLHLTSDRMLTVMNSREGLVTLKAGAVVLAMGCRERTRGALGIPGTRPAGIYTAGTAQKYVNRLGYLPGEKIVILGSGDIGLIMARRLTLEGARVKMVVEIQSRSGGLTRNIVQCLEDFQIPLLLNHTVTRIHGKDRVTGVNIARVDESKKPLSDTEEYVPCDALLLSVGLIPENELSLEAGILLDPATRGPVVSKTMETTVKGIFACGNVVKVHDLADSVSREGQRAGQGAAAYLSARVMGGIRK